MSHNVAISDKLKEILLNKLSSITLITEGDGSVGLTLTRGELLKLTREDRDFLSKYVQEYRRGHYKLRPKSFTQFIVGYKKYEADDEAYFSLMLSDLMREGLLKKVEVNGFKYWEFAGEVLNPKEFINIYKVDEDVFKTLIKEWGYYEVYEKFKDEMNAGRLNETYDQEVIAGFIHNNVRLTIRKAALNAYASVGSRLNEPFRDYYGNLVNKSVSLWVHVNNPKPEDVYKVLTYVEYSDLIASELLDNLSKIIKETTGLEVDTTSSYGLMEMHNYRLKHITLSAKATNNVGRTTVSLSLGVNYEKKSSDLTRTMHIDAEGSIKSQYVFDLMEAKVVTGIELPDDVGFRYDRENREVTVKVSREFPAIAYVDVSEPYKIAKEFRQILSMVGEKKLEGLKDEMVVVEYADRYYSSRTELGKVGDFINDIKWFKTKDLDEAVLKLIALKLEHGDEIREANIPLLDYLIGHAVLKGFDQDTLTKRINDPLETIIEFVEEGKLKVKYEGEPRIYFKGKPLENYVDESMAIPRLRRAIMTAIAIMDSEESFRLRVKVPS